MSALTEIIKQFSGQYNTITLQRPYIKFTGSPEGGLLLSQMIYWADRTKDPDGWFYKTYPEWEEEIGVKKKAVSKFASAWVRNGFLETDVRKNPQGTPVVHYRFSIDLFAEKLTDFLESANPPDRKCQDGVSNKSTRSKVLNDPIESANRPGRECQSARTTLYTSNISSNTSSTNTSPEREREEVFDEEVISGEFVSEDSPTRSDFVVKKSKASGSDLEILREDQIAAAQKKSREAAERVERVALSASVVDDRDVPGYERFKGDYEGLLLLLGRSFGVGDDAKIAWNVAFQGIEPSVEFWDGLRAYVGQKKADFTGTGTAIGVFGPVNFLRNPDASWRSALKIEEIRSEALKSSVDLRDPLSIRFARERMATEQAGQEFLKRRAMRRLENVV